MASMTGLHVVIVPSWWPSPEQPISGIFCTDYARAFAAAGARVGVVFPDLVSVRHLGKGTAIPVLPRLTEEDCQGVPVVRVRGLHSALRVPALQMRRFRRWLRRGLAFYRSRYGSPDVLHAMCAIPAGWACTHLDDPPASRVVVTEHTGSFSALLRARSGGGYVRSGLERSAAVVAVSEHLQRAMRVARGPGAIEVVGNPVMEEFSPSAPPDMQTDERGRPIYKGVFVGRLTAAKGIPEWIDAAVRLSRFEQFAIDWHVAGPGPLEAQVRERFAAAGLSGRLTMHGVCEKSHVARLIRESHFLILPSHAENCPLAICEALSTGRPVVATEATGCRALVGEGDGVLARIGSAESLKDSVVRVVTDYARWDWQGISARAHPRFSASAIASRYAEIFQSMVDA